MLPFKSLHSTNFLTKNVSTQTNFSNFIKTVKKVLIQYSASRCKINSALTDSRSSGFSKCSSSSSGFQTPANREATRFFINIWAAAYRDIGRWATGRDTRLKQFKVDRKLTETAWIESISIWEKEREWVFVFVDGPWSIYRVSYRWVALTRLASVFLLEMPGLVLCKARLIGDRSRELWDKWWMLYAWWTATGNNANKLEKS